MKANKILLVKYYTRMADYHHGEFIYAMVYANAEKKDGNSRMYLDFLKLASEHQDAEISYLKKLAAL